jgi:hypothetical protein
MENIKILCLLTIAKRVRDMTLELPESGMVG